jgi:hypothetical protein
MIGVHLIILSCRYGKKTWMDSEVGSPYRSRSPTIYRVAITTIQISENKIEENASRHQKKAKPLFTYTNSTKTPPLAFGLSHRYHVKENKKKEKRR